MKRLLQLRSNILVPSDDQMIHTGGNIIAGAAVGENGELKLSRKEPKMIINFRRGSQKRGRDDNLVNYANSKKQRYDKYSNGNQSQPRQ